jgi:hypothetical protein
MRLLILLYLVSAPLFANCFIEFSSQTGNEKDLIEFQWKQYEKTVKDCPNGFVIKFSELAFEIDTTLQVQSNTTILVESGSVVRIKKPIPVFAIKSSKNVQFSGGGTIEGQGGLFFYKDSDRKLGYKGSSIGLFIEDSQDIVIQNLKFQKFRGDAINIRSTSKKTKSSRVDIVNNRFTDIIDNPITIGSYSDYVLINSNRIYNISGDGVLIKGNYVTITNNHISFIHALETTFDGRKRLASAIAFSPSRDPGYEDYCDEGFYLISGNLITDVKGFGISNDKCRFITITNNIFKNLFRAKMVKNGKDLVNPGVIVTNNMGFDVGHSGIQNGSYWVIENNNYIADSKGLKNGVMEENKKYKTPRRDKAKGFDNNIYIIQKEPRIKTGSTTFPNNKAQLKKFLEN